jgi:RimJ/RimL family protein N-acetyltransferase
MLKGERVILGPVKRKYIDYFLKWFNDPEITQYLVMYRPMTRIEEEEWMEKLKDREDTILLSITIPKDDGSEILIGNCGIHRIDWKNRSAEIGITIGEKEYQNKGYGTEAIELLLDYAFSTVNLNRIELSVYEYNVRALKVYSKLGFIEEGRKRQFMWSKGAYHDAIIMSILAEEWKTRLQN